MLFKPPVNTCMLSYRQLTLMSRKGSGCEKVWVMTESTSSLSMEIFGRSGAAPGSDKTSHHVALNEVSGCSHDDR